MSRTLRSMTVVATVAAMTASGQAQSASQLAALKTTAEASDYKSTSTYDDVVKFMKAVDDASPLITVISYGTTHEGRMMPLAVVGTGLKDTSPASVKASGKLRVHIQGNIHAGEVEGKEAAQVGAHLAQPQLEVAQLLARPRELGGEPLERCERVLGRGGEADCSLALLRRKRLGCARRSLGELGDVAQPPALVAEHLLASRLEPVRRLDEGAELAQPRLLGRRATGQLVVPLASGSELAPGVARLAAAAQLLIAGEGVEHVELVRRPAEPALLELT